MTVGELIEKLSKLPPETVVATDGGLDNDITCDLTLYRIPATVERTSGGSVYAVKGTSPRLCSTETHEDVAMLAYWGQDDEAIAL
jgi:hypothetical protein